MEYLILLVLLCVLLLLVKFLIHAKIKEIKQIGENSELDKKTDIFPENIEIVRGMLKKLKNEDVVIKEKEQNESSFYWVLGNQIWIANIRNSYTRIQTIAHECLHSIQEKRLLWFNYLFSNIFYLYYIILLILTVIGKIHNFSFQISILLVLYFVLYIVRSFLETDAMTKAKFLAEEYMKETKIVSKEIVQEIVGEYEKLNKKGIPLVNYQLFSSGMFLVILYIIEILIITYR